MSSSTTANTDYRKTDIAIVNDLIDNFNNELSDKDITPQRRAEVMNQLMLLNSLQSIFESGTHEGLKVFQTMHPNLYVSTHPESPYFSKSGGKRSRRSRRSKRSKRTRRSKTRVHR